MSSGRIAELARKLVDLDVRQRELDLERDQTREELAQELERALSERPPPVSLEMPSPSTTDEP